MFESRERSGHSMGVEMTCRCCGARHHIEPSQSRESLVGGMYQSRLGSVTAEPCDAIRCDWSACSRCLLGWTPSKLGRSIFSKDR